MKNLIVIGHPDKKSFCYSGIYKTIKNEMEIRNEEFEVIDLYRDKLTRPRDKVIKKYQDLVTWTDRIYIISPVWWFRLTPRMEIFFDEVFTPGFAYQFINITKTYIPIEITENGVADGEDNLRPKHLKRHLWMIAKLIEQGIDIKSYYHWSLMDNFEWAEGYTMRFGLYHVDYETQIRTLRGSGKAYQSIIKQHQN